MAKKIKNPIEVRAILVFDEELATYQIEDVSVHYGMDCEHGNLGRKGLSLEENAEITNVVKDFLEEAIRQTDIVEGIAPEDSLLYVAP